MKTSIKLIVAGLLTATICGVLALFSGAANAATSYTVTLSASKGDNASATCKTSNEILLTTGADVSKTFAQAVVDGVKGRPLSAVEPSFVTDHYAAGSPRWVIELNNGKSLWGYPPNAGLNGTDFAWAVDNGNTYTSYAAAYAAAGAATSTIKDAFVVADGDQVSTTDKITGMSFNGEPVHCVVPVPPTTTTTAPPTTTTTVPPTTTSNGGTTTVINNGGNGGNGGSGGTGTVSQVTSVPVGAPSTGFGGASNGDTVWLLYTGIGALVAALALFGYALFFRRGTRVTS